MVRLSAKRSLWVVRVFKQCSRRWFDLMLSCKLFPATAPVAAAGVPPGRPCTHPLALPPSPWSQSTASSSSGRLRRTRCGHRRLLRPAAAVLESVGAMADHHQGEAAGWPSLLMTCGLMFFGAYGCGMLPRWLPNHERLTTTVSAADGCQNSKYTQVCRVWSSTWVPAQHVCCVR